MNLRRVRKRIKTINNVAKITKAMQMVAAVKMKKAQTAALEVRAYRERLELITQRVMSSSDAAAAFANILHRQNQGQKASRKKNLYLVVSSNKGLCGSFNVTLFRFLLQEVDFANDDFIVCGKKAAEFLTKMGGRVIADFSAHQPSVEAVSPIFSLVFKHFSTSDYGRIIVVYNQFISAFKFAPRKNLLLPFTDFTPPTSKETAHDLSRGDYLIEPSYESLIGALIEDAVKEKIKTALSDSEAGEHSARMLAMKNATDAAYDITYNLTLLRNKLRQQGITYELLDMIAAKESTEIN